MPSTNDVHRGQCLCGGVRYSVRGPLREVIACHCSQCRRSSGHHVAATAAARTALHLEEAATLRWYRSSPAADRGFCERCGSNLFWRQTDPAVTTISIMAGTLDPPTGVSIRRHIYVADRSDYYVIADGAAQFPGAGD